MPDPSLRCDGDVDENDAVDIDDLLLVISNWGPCPTQRFCRGDVASPPCGSGAVDIDDLLVVISNWGTCGGLPEDFPNGLMDCFNLYCNGTTGEEREECLTKCFEAYCIKFPEDCE